MCGDRASVPVSAFYRHQIARFSDKARDPVANTSVFLERHGRANRRPSDGEISTDLLILDVVSSLFSTLILLQTVWVTAPLGTLLERNTMQDLYAKLILTTYGV